MCDRRRRARRRRPSSTTAGIAAAAASPRRRRGRELPGARSRVRRIMGCIPIGSMGPSRRATISIAIANGGWIKAHPIPPDQIVLGRRQHPRTGESELHSRPGRIAGGAAGERNGPPGSVQRKVDRISIRAAWTRRASRRRESGSAAGRNSRASRHIDRPDQLPEEFAHLVSIGVAAPIAIGQMQDFKDSGRSSRSPAKAVSACRTAITTSRPSRRSRRRARFIGQQSRECSTLLGELRRGRARSRAVMALETRLAEASMPEIEQRDPNAIYHPMPLDGPRRSTPHLEWRRCSRAWGTRRSTRSMSACRDFFQALDRELAAHSARRMEDLFALASHRQLRALSDQGLRR